MSSRQMQFSLFSRNRKSAADRAPLTPPPTVERLEVRRLFAVLTVNSNADSNVRDASFTLREAISVIDGTLAYSDLTVGEQAQVNLAAPLGSPNDTIQFNIPGNGVQTISPASDLSPITKTVIIDGYSQPGAARATDSTPATDLIRLDGASDPGDTAVGLETEAPNVVFAGLVIDNFTGEGIATQTGSSETVLEGNYIGVTSNGLDAEGNGVGVSLVAASGSLIGLGDASNRNIISGNTVGMRFIGSDDGVVVAGNYIGVDVTGAGNVENSSNGIEFLDAHNVTIGGTQAGDGNVISGNGGDGILFDAGKANGNNVQGDIVEGNFIGTDSTGMTAVDNLGNGVEINGGAAGGSPATTVTIGGTAAGARNVISGNDGNGVFIHTAGADDNTVEGNYIGLNAAGTGVLPNFDGVFIQGGDNNTVGGPIAAARNVIGGNTQDGVDIDRGNQNIVQGNSIGVLADGVTAAGNLVDGVSIEFAADQNLIGGTIAKDGNIIANSGRNGIEISSGVNAVPTQNTIRMNSIYASAKLGIDLDVASDFRGVTANDPNDTDNGSNDLQNFPIITSATTTDSTVTVSGTLNSTPNTSFVLDFYSNASASASGHGEGKQYIGSISTVTDAATGNASFSGTFNTAIGANSFISATATVVIVGVSFGDTSEFAQTVQATPTPTSLLPTSDAPELQMLKTTLASQQTQFHALVGNKQQLASIKKMLTSATHQLNSAAALVKKQTALGARYVKEADLITALQTQLASQTAATAKAKIQKKINADTAAQTKILNQDKIVSASVTTLLNTVSTEETTIQSELTQM